MPKSHSTTSPGVVTPRRARARRSRSTASPRGAPPARLSSLVEKFVKDEFLLSPMKRRSVLPDDTDIEAPNRASWWKRVEGSSRDVLEALDTNKMTDELMVEEYEFEVEKDKQNQSIPENSDQESIASIVVPQRRLFNLKKQPQSKFTDMGSRKSLGRTNTEDDSIEEAPKNLFNKGPRNKPVFPAALLNSTNKTINKTVEPEPSKQALPNLFGKASNKRKNMFADLVLSDSEEDSEVQHEVFGFKKNNNKRISLGTRNRRMPSLTPSMTTETDIDDWYLLPSSTMIGAQEVSKMSVDDVTVPVQEENQDDTLTNESLNCEAKHQSTHKNSTIQDDENDKTLTTENIEDACKNQDSKINESKKNNKTHERSKSKLNVNVEDKTLLNKSSTRANAENDEIVEEAIVDKQKHNSGTKNQITVMAEQSLEVTTAELHGESVDKEESQHNMLLNITKQNVENYKDTETENNKQKIKPSAAQEKVQSVSKAASNLHQNEVDDDLPENVIFSGKQLERTGNYEAQKTLNGTKNASDLNQDDIDDELPENVIFSGKQLERTGNHEAQKVQNETKDASNLNQGEVGDDLPENVIFSGKHLERTGNYEAQKPQNRTKDVSDLNQDEVDDDLPEKVIFSGNQLERTGNHVAQKTQNGPKDASNLNQDEVDDDLPENVIFGGKQLERTGNNEAQKTRNGTKDASNLNQDEVDDDLPENVIFSGKQLERTGNDGAQKTQNGTKDAKNLNQDEVDDDLPENVIFSGKQLERTENYEAQKTQNGTKDASNLNQDALNDDLPENFIFSGKQLERTRNYEAQKSQNGTKDVSNLIQDEDVNDVCEKDKSGREIEPSVGKPESQAYSPGEASITNQDEDMENESDEQIEPSAEEQETHDHSEEGSQINQDEVMNDISEKDISGEESEPSEYDEKSQDESKEESQENADEEMGDVSENDKSEEIEPSVVQEMQNDSKEKSYETEEDIEEMVWNDNDDEIACDTSEARMNAKAKQNDDGALGEKDTKTVDITNKSRNLTNKSQKIVESSEDNAQIEEDVVDVTPNISTHDTTGRNRKKNTVVKSPEAVLQNMTADNESFRPIARSTTFRKSKSLYDTMNRPSLAPVQESTLGSEGSRNSSTEGSEWDSHRTTRKTIRQTFGKEYTTRKSLRALVMEQSAKRQTELYSKNTSNINKTKNKSVLEGNYKNASKLNKTKNKTVLDEANKTATIDKTNNKTVSEDVNNKNASTINKTKNKTVLEDVNDQHIRFRRTSSLNLSSSMQLEKCHIPKSPVHETSTHHVLDPLISEHQVFYHKSLHDNEDPEISEQISNHEDSINIPVMENNDSGPEISMNASYGQGMSADTAHEALLEESDASDKEMKENSGMGMEAKEITRRNASVRAKSIHRSDQEVLDYEASELEKSEQDISDNEHQENVEQDDSVQDEEKENSEPDESEKEEAEESEVENEDSQQEMEVESEHDSHQDIDAGSGHEESQQEIESEQEESQQEIDAESDHEESQQEIESEQEESQQEIAPDSDQEESQQEIDAESDHEESQQEIESEQEESQQEIEPESDQEESQQEIELGSEQESDNEERDNSQPESDQESEELSRAPERDSEDENENLVSGLHSQYHATNSRVSRVVFDTQMMSVEEIDFEGISRQTDNDISEQSERELSKLLQVSEPSVTEISVGTKRSKILMEMQKIAQKNEEERKKIREQVQKWLKPPRPCRSPQPDYSVPRKTKETKEPKQPKKPKRTAFPMETLPSAFVKDLQYKPPKRFQPANAPWITKRLYKFLETKLEPKYDYRARVRAEELVESVYKFAKLVRRRAVAPPDAVDELKVEMARLQIVTTHFDFYEFFKDFMPREVRVKVCPDIVNKIPMPWNGIFGEILQPRPGR